VIVGSVDLCCLVGVTEVQVDFQISYCLHLGELLPLCIVDVEERGCPGKWSDDGGMYLAGMNFKSSACVRACTDRMQIARWLAAGAYTHP
jgi:hypothetical protein